MKTLLYHGRVITPWRVLKDGYVLIDAESGLIEAVGSGAVGDIVCDTRIDDGDFPLDGQLDQRIAVPRF